MIKKKLVWLLVFFILIAGYAKLQAQCSALESAVTIDFNTDQACAPVTVTQFEITYYFLVAQNPADIEILYQWNDPANTVTTVNIGSGLIAGAGDTEFTANATFTYVDNNGQCAITPTAYIIINGVLCPTSQQILTAFFWGTDEQANGNVIINPTDYEVCFDNPVVNATFADNSEFNCNIFEDPDHPNRFARHVQFVYGTNHNPAATIRNLTLTDGGPQGLTSAAGNLVTPQTRGTGAVMVTAGYFGPVDAIPFPADGPVSVTFPMNAPANAANLVGNRFEITLFNWNICNPWNGDPINPNYEDAVLATAYIVIVESPAPAFETRDNTGTPTTDFCINENIFLANLTPNLGSYSYTWTFYDDAAGTIQVGTSTATNPTFAYTTGGPKLIRLEAENQSAQGSCVEQITHAVNITPALNAQIGVTDTGNTPITADFCQNATAPLTTFTVRFHDFSTGVVTPTTQWRWEFTNENNVVIRQEPFGGGFSPTAIGPFDQPYTTRGIYRVRLIIQDNTTGCGTTHEVLVRLYEKPVPIFTTDRVCEGQQNTFTEASTLTAINGETITLKEWDFDYDGVTFNKDPAFDNQSSFSRSLGSAGVYQVALRVTTNQNSCSAILVVPATVDPVPLASFTPDVISGCSILTVNFTNNSVAGQPDIIDSFIWEIDEGTGFVPATTQHPTDPGFTNVYTHDFENTMSTARTFGVRLRVVTMNGCEQASLPVTITVSPGTNSGFISTNYSPFNDNCSPQSVNFSVDAQTQLLNPSDYLWRISDVGGVISEASTGTTPAFSYNFVNPTQALKDFLVTLITTLPSGCSGDSVRTIRISPVPSSAFDIDTLVFDCEKMEVSLEAIQKGLSEYHWVIRENGIIVQNSITSSDIITYEANRPAATSANLNVSFSLDTKNFANCVSSATTQDIVVPPQEDIGASFTVSPLSQTLPGSTVTITNTTNPGTWSYVWDFGDGNTSTVSDASISHTYVTYGVYTITLTVTSNTCIETQSAAITILAIPPIIDFDYAPPSGCVPLTVQFTNLSKYAELDKFLWEFGDGQATSKAIDPTYTYFEPGTYTVSLSGTNSTGQIIKETKLLIIEVFPKPSAQFDIKPKLVYIPGGILYTSNKSFGATSYLWDFGDGTTSTSPEPEHTYKEEGQYDISLVAMNVYGCADTTVMQNVVQVQKGGTVLIPNAFSPSSTGPGGGSTNGKNDVFLPLVRGVVEFEMLVFNRWGELLFESRDTEIGWDGYHKGKLCQQDVYVYKITASMSDGQKIVRVGDINLIR